MKPSEQLIPNDWKQAVINILRTTPRNALITSSRARKEWESAFPESFPYQRNDAIIETLNKIDARGREIFGMQPAGTVWEFFIHFNQRKVYIKINLLACKKKIILISTHIPNKGDKL